MIQTKSMQYDPGDLVEIERIENIYDTLFGRAVRKSTVPGLVIRGSIMSTHIMDRPVKIVDREYYTVIAAGKKCSVGEEEIYRKLSPEVK